MVLLTSGSFAPSFRIANTFWLQVIIIIIIIFTLIVNN